jgi:hypothetical protein
MINTRITRLAGTLSNAVNVWHLLRIGNSMCVIAG